METSGDIKSGFIGALITASVGMIIWFIQWYVQKDKYKLKYVIRASESFPSGQEVLKVYTIILKNTGNKPVTQCQLLINFDEGKIDSFKFSNDKLVEDISHSERQIESNLPLLNPKESLQLSITAKGGKEIGAPSIDARAIGVNAKPEKQYASTVLAWSFFIVVLAGLVYLVSDDSGSRMPNREEEIFVILNDAGLSEVFPQVVGLTDDGPSYKNTGYFLFHSYLRDPEHGERYLNAMKKMTEVEAIQASSKASILYLLAKGEQLRNNTEKANMYLAQCKETAPEMYEHLMRHDGNYDLVALQKWLKSNWSHDTLLSGISRFE